MKKTILHACLAALLLTLMVGVASAQYSYSVGGGTLKWEAFPGGPEDCGPPPDTYTDTTFEDFTFTSASGVVTTFFGDVANVYVLNGCVSGFGYPNGQVPSPLVLNGTSFIIDFYGNNNGGGSATYTAVPGVVSTFDPDYKVISILYSPPGNQSSQGYTDATSNGTTTTVGSSFTFSSTLTFSSGVKFGDTGLGGSASVGYATTSSNSSAFTQTFTDTTALATDDNSSSTYNPTGSNADNHNLDSFVIWLNPQVTVTSYGGTPLTYTAEPQATSGVSAIVPDILPALPAITMEATPPGTKGVTTVPVAYLIPQAIASDVDGVNSYMPGLGAICKNNSLYTKQLAADLAAGAGQTPPAICTQANQCGCAPSDFVAILQQDPLLNYNGTTYTATPYAGTESPLESDGSGASACAEDPVPTGDDCRYVIVPITAKSTTPLYEKLSGSDGVTYMVSDATTTTETNGHSLSHSVGLSFGGGLLVASLVTADTWTWTDYENVGSSTGTANTMNVTLKTSTAACDENVNIYEDTLYHTFAFQIPTGITTCP